MIVFFTFAYFAIYIYYFRLDRELGFRKMPALFANEQEFSWKYALKRFSVPLCVIAAVVTGVYFAFDALSLPILILGTYIFSYISRKKVREINLFDKKFKDGDRYEQ